MPLLSSRDLLPGCPRRIAVAGASGAGKTTLADVVSELTGLPHVEIDALFHGPGWTPRPTFESDVRRFVADPAWVTEWQYSQVRDLVAARAQLLVWLDLSRWRVMDQVSRRTFSRRVRREILWNGNIEPPLWTVFTDREHIVRWSWATHQAARDRVISLHRTRPDLHVVRLPSRLAVRQWVAGPLQDLAGRCRSR